MELSNIDIKELAGFVYEKLKAADIDAVLVGGACVSIYSHNRYQSYDLDFVTYASLKTIEAILSPLGFRREGRCFLHADCPFILDFVNPPVAIGQEPIRIFETLTTRMGTLQLLTPTDCVKDRLSAYFHWDDEQGLSQAIIVSKDQAINVEEVIRWAHAEGHGQKLDKFLKALE